MRHANRMRKAETKAKGNDMTVKEQLQAAIRSGDSQRIHEATERWMAGTISTDELNDVVTIEHDMLQAEREKEPVSV